MRSQICVPFFTIFLYDSNLQCLYKRMNPMTKASEQFCSDAFVISTLEKEGQSGMTDRVWEHPILGVQEKGSLVKFIFDGQELQGYEGEPIAVALKAAGVMVHRYTKKEHKPRGVFCAIGRCTDCVMVVDGIPNVRTCITPLREGMIIHTQYGVSKVPFEGWEGGTKQ